MKKMFLLIAISAFAGCATQNESWQTAHLYQRLVLKTRTPKGFTMVPITKWEDYRPLDHRVGGDTMLQYCSKKLR